MDNKNINKKIKKINITNYKLTEFGMAQLFSDIFGEEIKHVILNKQFFIYNNKMGIWKKDIKETVERNAEKFLSEICPRLIERVENDRQRSRYREWIKNRQSNAAIGSILKSVKRKKGIAIESSEFDQIAKNLKLKNCIYDLESMECIPDDKGYLITKTANVIFNENVDNYAWRDFLMSIMDNDEEMYEYLLRVILYAMQGNPVDHCMFVLLGLRMRNGKSTFVNGLLEFFGNYGTTLPPQALAKKNSGGDKPSPDIIKLKGVRFVNIAESARDLKLDVALIKALTGMDNISARKLYSDYEDFVNRAVFFMHMNRLPIVDDPTLFAGERVIVIPFDVRFNKNKRDTKMPEKLATESALSGLLNEVIRVHKKYKDVSIKAQLPLKVRKATNKFEYSCDIIGHFIKSCFLKDSNARTSTKAVYERYKEFVFKKEIVPIKQKALTIEIENRGYIKTRWGKSGFGFKGISLK